jgi:hypothetical protein
MIVNDLVKTIGYTRNKLDHFEFCIWNPVLDDWITLRNTTADQYVHICDREVIDWMIDDIDDDMISINMRMVDSDYETFRDYIKE